MLTQRSNYCFRFFARHFDQHEKTGMALHECRNIAVLSTTQQIAFPMARNRSIFRLGGSFADRNRIDDLPPTMSMFAGMARAAHAPLRPQVVHQLFFQYSPRLNEQGAVDGLVGHSHTLVIGMLGLQPSGNLLGRPVQNEFTRNDVMQLVVHGQQTSLRTQSPNPRLAIRIMGTIGRAPTMTRNFPAHRRGGATQQSCYLTNRRVGSASSRDVFSLSKRECQSRTATSNRRNAATKQQ